MHAKRKKTTQINTMHAQEHICTLKYKKIFKFHINNLSNHNSILLLNKQEKNEMEGPDNQKETIMYTLDIFKTHYL